MRKLKVLILLVLASLLGAATWLAVFASKPLQPPVPGYEFNVRPGASLRGVSRRLSDEGLLPDANSFWILARILGKDRAMQAGTYRLDAPMTPIELLDKLNRGDVVNIDIAFIEGTTVRQWLAALAQQPRLKQTLPGKSKDEVRAAAGLGEGSLEGWLFPDTYRFDPGTADADVLKRAHAAMKKRLAEAWQARDPDVPLANPYEALILASIVEKETGAAAERPLVASVFVNRLRKGMRLQTDPTVIYGMGAAFDGNIRKKDLTTDTPWNTYTRDGLPPTPIAMPGAGSIAAVSKPAQTDFLYFVGKGDGTHYFSKSLDEHNRAVAKYQLKR